MTYEIFTTNQSFPNSLTSTIYANCRSVGNEPPHIALDGNELSDPLLLLIEQNAETEVSAEPSSLDATTVTDDQNKDNSDPVEEANDNRDNFSVHVV